MDNRKYDVWLNWVITEKCNINCEYCCLMEKTKKKAKAIPVNIPELLKTLTTTGKTFKIEFTGGEPLLVPNIVQVMEALSKKHFFMMCSNLLSQKIKQICERIDPERFLIINASMHIGELEKHNLVDKYLKAVLMCKDHKFPIHCLIVGYPPFLKKIEKYRTILKNLGLTTQTIPFFGTYHNKKYPESYTKRELEQFHITEEVYEGEKRFFRKGKICNAGYNVVTVNVNGNIYNCHKIQKYRGNIYKGFRFSKKLIRCPSNFCPCPFPIFDPYLFKKAIQECLPPKTKSWSA
jgi:MoaA/NifB/PqqE/SkfB family radical SAM enzyme